MHDLKYRIANANDALTILRLHHLNSENSVLNYYFNFNSLTDSLNDNAQSWLVGESVGTIYICVCLHFDMQHRLGRISHTFIDPSILDPKPLFDQAISKLLNFIKMQRPDVDTLYTTTTTKILSMNQIDSAIDHGFSILGIFPNAIGNDFFKINSLAAYFFNDCLTQKRFDKIQLHHEIVPLYNLVKKQLSLPDVVSIQPKVDIQKYESMPDLELIKAPKFVNHRFEKLKIRNFFPTSFYPFHKPNTIISDPAQEIEIFLKMSPNIRFATIIGERFERAIDPVELYRFIAAKMRDYNISYIELINDACDHIGIDALLRAGFIPTAYFPCLKFQGSHRRDFVVFGKSYERFFRPQVTESRFIADFIEFYKRFEVDSI